MRSLIILLLSASASRAELPPRDEAEEPRPSVLEQVAAPCLLPAEERRYVVTWWIEEKSTGERRDAGSQEVRLRC